MNRNSHCSLPKTSAIGMTMFSPTIAIGVTLFVLAVGVGLGYDWCLSTGRHAVDDSAVGTFILAFVAAIVGIAMVAYDLHESDLEVFTPPSKDEGKPMSVKTKIFLVDVTCAVAVLAVIVGCLALVAFADDTPQQAIVIVAVDFIAFIAIFSALKGLAKLHKYVCSRLASGTHN